MIINWGTVAISVIVSAIITESIMIVEVRMINKYIKQFRTAISEKCQAVIDKK
ncbi:hypothetical protein [Clostridium ihumii]|uniref:hypothetical protein n=1 Tax=Clostridium ihumii TaxID=1470356 RepID=UPI000AE46955|nr:hypothetical protein [Clostridium ihumii]